jgi:hypothetical protein
MHHCQCLASRKLLFERDASAYEALLLHEHIEEVEVAGACNFRYELHKDVQYAEEVELCVEKEGDKKVIEEYDFGEDAI